MQRFDDAEAYGFAAFRVEADHGVVVHGPGFAVDFGFEDERPFFDFVAEDHFLGGAEELEDGEKFTRWGAVARDGFIDARAEHLVQVGAWCPARWDVVDVWFGAELWVKWQGDVFDFDEVVEWVLRRFDPRAIVGNVDEAVEADFARAYGHAACFHGYAVAQWVIAFNTGVAPDAFFACARGATIHRFFVGAGFDAFAVATTAALVDQDDAIFWSFVDGFAWAGCGACGVGAVVAQALQVEEPGLVFGERGSFCTEAEGIAFVAGGGVFVEEWCAPFGVGRQVANGLLCCVSGFKDGHAVVDAVGGGCARLRGGVPFHVFSGGLVCLVKKFKEFDIPVLGVAAVGFGFDVLPPHVFLAFGEGPGGFACAGAGLAA